jgi:N-dimethylarginine dimethylaminohydrolase
MKVFTKNEYSRLKSVIVGRADNANWPVGDMFFDRMMTLSTYPDTLKRGPVASKVIEETREDLFALIDLLKENGVSVHRPEMMDWRRTTASLDHVTTGMHSYSARDLILTVGNMIIECPTPFISRQNETRAYHVIKNEAIKDGCRWIAAPRAIMETAECVVKDSRMNLTERYPIFDAANVLKFNDKLLYLVSGTANHAGAEWLQKIVGTEFEVIKWEGVYAFAHIDSTLTSLNADTILVNAERVKEDTLPKFLRSHKKIWFSKCTERKFHKFPYASKWIGMNILSIDPETVIMDPTQTFLKKQLQEAGFRVLDSELRHSRTLGGGHHCITCDLERE